MKKMRRTGKALLSLFAAVAIVMSFVVVPVSAYTETTWFSQDFEGEVSIGNAEVRTDTDGNKYEVSTSSWGVVHLCENKANPLNTGIIKVSVDVKAPNGSSGNGGYAFLYNTAKYGWTSDNQYLMVAHVTDNTVRFANHGLGSIEANVWYTVESIIDLDTHKCIVAAYNTATGEVIGQYTGVLPTTDTAMSDWPADGAAGFTRITTRGASEKVYFDNISIKKLSSGYRYANDFQHSTAPNGTSAIVSSGDSKYLNVDTGRWHAVDYTFNPISADKARVSFDFMDTLEFTSGASVYYALGNSGSINTDSEVLILLREGYNSNTNAANMECYSSTQNRRLLGLQTPNVWFNCEAIVDMDTKKVTTTITNKSTGQVIGTVTDTLEATSSSYSDWPNTVTTFDTFRVAAGVGTGNNVYIDNLVIEQVVAAPTVSVSGIEIYDALGELQSTWTAVSPNAHTITIDFGTNMSAQTVNASNIYLIEEGAVSAVSGTVTYSNQVATLTLSSALNAGANYILHIDGDVANTAGDTLGNDQEYTIITAAGTTSAAMGTPTIGGAAAGSFSSITAGQVITVPVTYMNTTGSDKTLRFICAYYGGSLANLKKAELKSTTVPGSVESGDYEFTHTFQNVPGATFLRIMIWDGFDKLVPLSTFRDIAN